MVNNDTTSATQETIQLPAFTARNTGDRIITRCLGSLTLKLNSNSKSHTRGTVDIEGQTIPILSRSPMSRKPDKVIDHGSCILLLEAGQPHANYKIGFLVDDVLDIPHIAKENL